jgi:hypothetical protein
MGGGRCCVVASIHAPPRYRLGALPNELTQLVPLRGIKPRSAAYKAAASSTMLQGLADKQEDLGASRRNQTSISSLRGACSVTELCRRSYGFVIASGAKRSRSRWLRILDCFVALRAPRSDGADSIRLLLMLFVAANLQMDGHSASHPIGGSCTMPRPIIFGRSRCKTARSLQIAFPNFRHSSAAPRAHAVKPTIATPVMRTILMRAAQTLLRSDWCFLR